MKRILTSLLATLGLISACGQKNYEKADVSAFALLTASPDVVLLDVRTAGEYKEGHIEGALNVDVEQGDFLEKARTVLSHDKEVAVYCRSGRRSAHAANILSAEGYRCINLKGGITAWKRADRPLTTDTYEIDVFRTKQGKPIKFHALMHASIWIAYDGKNMLIDPVGKLGNRTVDYTAMPKADFLFVTHEHLDHFDQETMKVLSGETTHIITNKRCAEMFGSGEVMANGDVLTVANDFKVEAVPAYNTTEGHLQFHPKGRDNGYVLTIDGLRIYIAGDTEDIPEMDDLKDIDIAFLPCNQPYTMTTDQLVKAARRVKPKVLFPYHYGQTDISGIPSLLQEEGIEVRIRHYE